MWVYSMSHYEFSDGFLQGQDLEETYMVAMLVCFPDQLNSSLTYAQFVDVVAHVRVQ